MATISKSTFGRATINRHSSACCRRIVVAVLIWVAQCIVPNELAYAADSAPEYRLKAAYLYNFIKFVSWPDHGSTADKSLRVCIVGVDPFGAELSFLHGKVLQNRPITLQPATIATVDRCQVVFISRSARDQLAEILSTLHAKPVLTVSDIEGFAYASGMIGFAMNSSELQLQINLQAAHAAGLEISSKLLEVATVVPNGAVKGDKQKGTRQ